jgi:hypothetical protein
MKLVRTVEDAQEYIKYIEKLENNLSQVQASTKKDGLFM